MPMALSTGNATKLIHEKYQNCVKKYRVQLRDIVVISLQQDRTGFQIDFSLSRAAWNSLNKDHHFQADFSLDEVDARWESVLCPTNNKNIPNKPSAFNVVNRSNCNKRYNLSMKDSEKYHKSYCHTLFNIHKRI